jgi:outer membrane scaffolding protein for murein synthesis (MipA/OmpV family)
MYDYPFIATVLKRGQRLLCALAVMAGACLRNSRVLAQPSPSNSVDIDATVLLRYGGSKSYRMLLLPELSPSEPVFASAAVFAQGLIGGGAFPAGPYAAVGLLTGVQPGRDRSRRALLNGTGDIATSFEYSARSRWHLRAASDDIRFLQSAHSGYGNRVTVKVSYALVQTPADQTSVAADTVRFNENSQQVWSGLDSGQTAASTARPQDYRPSAGFSQADLKGSWSYRLNQQRPLQNTVGFGSLLGDPASGPVNERSAGVFGSMVAV